jgi:hypothetical protein
MNKELSVYIDAELAGTLALAFNDAMTFTYSENTYGLMDSDLGRGESDHAHFCQVK